MCHITHMIKQIAIYITLYPASAIIAIFLLYFRLLWSSEELE